MARRGIITILLRHLPVGAFPLVAFAGPAPTAFTQELYVWQRGDGPAIRAALHEFAPQCDGFNVLAAEVSWRAGQPHLTRTAPDFAALGRPVGLSLRIGTYPGPFAENDPNARALATLAAGLAGWAASLLPNDSEQTAEIPTAAGRWLMQRDPDAARPFQELLGLRYPHTELGRRAAVRRWFPDEDEAPASP